MTKRFPVKEIVNPLILGDKLTFPTTKSVAKNRFLKAALTERVATYVHGDPEKSGIPTKELCNLYEKWSHGGFGVVLTGNVVVDPIHLESAGNMIIHHSVDTNERRQAFKSLANSMKSIPDVLSIVQLSNAGRQTPVTICKNPISASDVQLTVKRRGTGFGKPKGLTKDEIKDKVIKDFVYAAKYCYECGFDGIQLHSAHGYLLAQFISLTTNKRTDEYGGSWENRCRLNLEIYKAIRREIPENTGFIVGIKMNSVEFQSDGLDINDAVLMCKEYQNIGYDFIELSGGTIEKLAFTHLNESTIKREAFFLEFSKKIKAELNKIIVYLTGGFRTVPGMIKAIEDNACEGIGLGRPITAELDLPAKILSGKVQSALQSPFEQDFAVGNVLSNLQMWQAEQTSLKDVKEINEGIIDISNDKHKALFEKEFKKYLDDIMDRAAMGKPLHGTMQMKI